MKEKENAPVSAGTPAGASNSAVLGHYQTATTIISENEDNFTDKTAKRIFEVLGAIYAKENGLDVDVKVYKNGKAV